MMHKVKCTDCTTLKKCNIIHQTGLKVTDNFFFNGLTKFYKNTKMNNESH
jgi:hypothetical protein